MKTRVQNKKILTVKKVKNIILNRIKINEQRLAITLFLRTQKKTIEVLSNVLNCTVLNQRVKRT